MWSAHRNNWTRNQKNSTVDQPRTVHLSLPDRHRLAIAITETITSKGLPLCLGNIIAAIRAVRGLCQIANGAAEASIWPHG